jgi:hypothetical protein
MLPLVRHIVADVMDCQARLVQMQAEKDRLDRHRRDLSWPERSRRYQLQEEITGSERHLREALGELDNLGVALDRDSGEVGFPTMVNKQKAFFSWRPGEDALSFWHYAGERDRHTIPASWTKPESRSRSKSRGPRDE